MSNHVVQGFSPTNRWLLYTSVMLAPAQFLSGIGSNCPSNLGFLAYNYYTQIAWYRAVRNKQLHALSMLPAHFNIVYFFTYWGGVTSGNIYMGVLQGLGTAGVLILNTVSAWESWASNLEEGYGVYQFFFFGWRTLTPGWRKFFLCWQISDSMFALAGVVVDVMLPIAAIEKGWDREVERWYKYPAVPAGAVVMLLFFWPLILWTELIVQRNRIESETDMIAVWLFVAQCVAMLVPSCMPRTKRKGGREGEEGKSGWSSFYAGIRGLKRQSTQEGNELQA